MKVVHIITNLGQGGAEAMLEKLIACARGQEPELQHEVISLRELAVVGPRLQAAGVSVHALGMGGVLNTVTGFFRLVARLRQQPRDAVIQTWMYHADLLGGLAGWLSGRRRIVWNVRQTGVERRNVGVATFLVIRACALVSRWLPRTIVCCADSARVVHVKLGYDDRKCVVIANGFDTGQFCPNQAVRADVRARLGFTAEHRVIGTVARLDPQKDHRTLALAAGEICRLHPEARFLWVGRDVDSSASLTELLDKQGISEKVVRLGQQSDVATLLCAMDAFCLSSRAEGFPNVLGEAMSCALPCVTTDAGDSRRLLGDDRWVVSTEAPAKLAQALSTMLAFNEQQSQALGARNRQRIQQHFGIETAWHLYRAVYQQLS